MICFRPISFLINSLFAKSRCLNHLCFPGGFAPSRLASASHGLVLAQVTWDCGRAPDSDVVCLWGAESHHKLQVMPIPRGQEETERQDCRPHGPSEGQHCKNSVELSAGRNGLLVGNERKLHADEILKEIEWLKKPLILMTLNYSCDLLDF